MYIFSLGDIKTNDIILKKIVRWKSKLIKYAKIHILMVLTPLCVTSQVEKTKKCNSTDSESNKTGRNGSAAPVLDRPVFSR